MRQLDDNPPMAASKNPGRRTSMRVPCGLRAEVVVTGSETLVAEIMNISQRGLFLRPLLSSPGDVLKLSTSLASDVPVTVIIQFSGEARPLRVPSQVAWKNDLGVGINFDGDPPERLRDFVSDLFDAESAAPLLPQVESARIEIAG
jgi:hypothetical protein